MSGPDEHPIDAAAAAYRHRARLLCLTDVRPHADASELDEWVGDTDDTSDR